MGGEYFHHTFGLCGIKWTKRLSRL